MLKGRLALAGVVVIVAGLGAAPAAWADTFTPPPKPLTTGHNGATIVCHAYPGARAATPNGFHGTPDLEGNCTE